ncbi:MAG: hypothetical protein FD143_3528 [Ignavibacteria bacterium]|nr:MAG: hypothetical protein FD143_3528 [Ignavibacteria bacterium]KAF0147586.1 MAG: hypothetical protein FD188_3530 [Ignavibacteria bacterium]
MNTDQILRALRHLLANSRVHFLGVFAADQLPSFTTIRAYSPCCYVANTDETGQGGSHWVAFFHPSPNKLEFFDSFCKLPKEYGYDIHKAIQIQHNKIQVQGRRSNVCGQLCIYFLYNRAHGIPFTHIISKLQSVSLSASDAHVYSFVHRIMKRLKIN